MLMSRNLKITLFFHLKLKLKVRVNDFRMIHVWDCAHVPKFSSDCLSECIFILWLECPFADVTLPSLILDVRWYYVRY